MKSYLRSAPRAAKRASASAYLTWRPSLKVQSIHHDLILVPVSIITALLLEQSCYNEDGRDYRGLASRTVSKQECLPWNRQTVLKTTDHPELIGGHNYCRNPGGAELQPWCFVAGVADGQRPRREFCSLPKCCKPTLNSQQFKETNRSLSLLSSTAAPYDMNWLYIIVPIAAVGALVILLLIVLCIRRSRRQNSKTSSVLMKGPYSCGMPVTGNGAGSNIARLAGVHPHQTAGQQMEMNALLPPSSLVSTLQGPSGTPSRIHVPEISLHAVRFQQELGEGAFGKVTAPRIPWLTL